MLSVREDRYLPHAAHLPGATLIDRLFSLLSTKRSSSYSYTDTYTDTETDTDTDTKTNTTDTTITNTNTLREIESVELVTMPALLGYAFNPVSFYYGRDARNALRLIVCEVNNTFGESHLYIRTFDTTDRTDGLDMMDKKLDMNSDAKENGGLLRQRVIRFDQRKDFHVSPFNNVRGIYDMRFRRDVLHLSFSLRRESDEGAGEETGDSNEETGDAIEDTGDSSKDTRDTSSVFFFADLKCQWQTPLTQSQALWLTLRHPVSLLGTSLRILFQATLLAFRHRLSVYEKPVPRHEGTQPRRGPGLLERLAVEAATGALDTLARDRLLPLTLSLPDGTARVLGTAVKPGVKSGVEVVVRDYEAVTEWLMPDRPGLWTSFVAGKWHTRRPSDLPTFLSLFTDGCESNGSDSVSSASNGSASNGSASDGSASDGSNTGDNLSRDNCGAEMLAVYERLGAQATTPAVAQHLHSATLQINASLRHQLISFSQPLLPAAVFATARGAEAVLAVLTRYDWAPTGIAQRHAFTHLPSPDFCTSLI